MFFSFYSTGKMMITRWGCEHGSQCQDLVDEDNDNLSN